MANRITLTSMGPIMDLRRIIFGGAAISFATLNPALGQEQEGLSLKLVKAEIHGNARSFTASLLRRMDLESGVTISAVVTNNSATQIHEVVLWKSECAHTNTNNTVEPDCFKLHQIELRDGYGNDLRGGARPPSITLYPGERSAIEIHGRRPVSQDGSFSLRIVGTSLSATLP